MFRVTKDTLRRETFSGLFVFCLLITGCSDSTGPDASTSPGNDLPVAVDDAFTVVKGDTMKFDLVANDTDADDGLDVASVAIIEAASGSVEINSDGTVVYTHDGSDAVSDRFTYTVMDNCAAVSNAASVSISVLPVAPPAVVAGVYSATIVEGADDLEFVISLAETSTVTVSVDYATVDGTAVDGEDYSATTGVVQFAPGENRKFITIPVVENTSPAGAGSKHMQLVLSQPQYAIFGVNSATGTIIDSDAMPTDSAYDANWGAAGAFTNAAKCGEACHKTNGNDMSFDGKDISPGTQWRHSVMANAFNDPYWQAAVQDEAETFPALSGFIEDTCTTCHAPMARTHAHQTNANLDVDGYYRFDNAKNENHAREGVSCTVCHQIANINLGSEQSFSGQFTIADSSDADYKRIYGQYAGPVGNNMNMQTGHRPTEGPHISDSALCASCHTLYTPALDPDTGTPSGIDFLEQGPYLEWQNSNYATALPATHCQDCHMPEPFEGYSTAISLLPPVAPGDRTPYGQHTLVGGNAHLLELLRDFSTELGIDDATTADGFNDQIALTRNFLGSAATVSVSEPQQVGNRLNFDVEVTNDTGHKMPSSYPSRRAWLHVTVKNSSGNVIFESGKPDARGYLSTDEARLKADCMAKDKLDGFDSSLCYEPHRDVIDDPSHVAIYETVLGDIHGTITHTLLQGAQYLKDNRLPPAGFTNSRAGTIEPQTIPSGVTGDSDFNCIAASEGCGADTVHYQVNTEAQTGPYTVEARLLYQATQPGFVDGMHTDGDRVNRFKVMYDAVPPSVEVLATAVR
ncbi:MAG: cadherin-like domain-containing protein [Gammaproteobacteria bacterium]|nr:cadherin-like domain-containing protein [Gammaproteobacteria bacterium]